MELLWPSLLPKVNHHFKTIFTKLLQNKRWKMLVSIKTRPKWESVQNLLTETEHLHIYHTFTKPTPLRLFVTLSPLPIWKIWIMMFFCLFFFSMNCPGLSPNRAHTNKCLTKLWTAHLSYQSQILLSNSDADTEKYSISVVHIQCCQS